MSTAAPTFPVMPTEFALQVVAVERLVVHALVAFHLHERPQARIEFVGNAADAAILIEVAVGVARIFAVGEQRRIVSGAIERTFEGNREAVELLRDADGLPDVEVDRQLRDPELGVGAARIVGVDDAAQLQIDLPYRA